MTTTERRNGVPTATGALVECVGVARTFGTGERAVVAVHGAECAVRGGDRIAITGPSGSGKSTLLHLFAGLDTPTAGIMAWPRWDESPHRHPGRVGMIFQGPSLLPALNGWENVAMPLLLAGMPVAAARTVAVAALDQVGLAAIAQALPDEMSGGQSQRIAVARALAMRPALILADEPTGQLDRANAHNVIDVLLAAAAPDTALVICTHDQRVARRMSRQWRMVDGRLATDAPRTDGSRS